MYDIEALEKKWKKYKKNKNRVYYYMSIVFLSITLIFLVNIEINMNSFNKYIQSLSSSTDMIEDLSKQKFLLNSSLKRIEVSKRDEMKIDQIKKIKKEDILVDIPILDDIPIVGLLEKKEEIKRKKIHLDIFETSSITAYKDVENRFYQTHEIDDSLFLAKSYYKKNNYKKAEYWALQTNKLDKNLEESLLIFVKSKVKLGYKNKAIEILMSYIKKTNSEDAKKLLYRINNNKF